MAIGDAPRPSSPEETQKNYLKIAISKFLLMQEENRSMELQPHHGQEIQESIKHYENGFNAAKRNLTPENMQKLEKYIQSGELELGKANSENSGLDQLLLQKAEAVLNLSL
jgi:hypothetical protein